jgi:hypothetical protein
MMTNESRRRTLLGSAALVALAIGGASPAFAQAETGNPNDNAASGAGAQTAAAEDSGDAIVVTGFRRSLENAVAEKKNRDQVVESISAEDIGKLPDASIGIDRPPPGPHLAARLGPLELDLDPRLLPGFLDDPAQRPRADHDRRQSRRRI